MSCIWGIDLGGTKIEAAVMDADTFEVISRERIPTEASLGYEHIVSRIALLIDQMVSKTGLTRPNKIGMGTPGVSDPATGLMRNANTVCLIGKPLIADVRSALQMEVIAANDANCFALAESRLGAGQGSDVVFGVILGTGVGGGIVVGGRVIEGLNGIAGEWGHNVLDPTGHLCYCGRKGCVETILSGPAIERGHLENFGMSLRLPEIAKRAAAGDSECSETLDHTCDWLGRALSVVVNILDPSIIVLGGGVSSLDVLYTKGLDSLRRHSFHDSLKTNLVRAKMGGSAGVLGAALLTNRA